jgi:hypothetical protein
VSFYGRAVCHCVANVAMRDAVKDIAPSELKAKEVWIHKGCGGIICAVQEVVQVVRGPANTSGLLHAAGKMNGQTILTWGVGKDKINTVEFHTYPRRFVVQPEPLIFQTWQLLMTKVDVILAEPAGAADNALEADAREVARHEARGIAQVLGILMRPFMDPVEGSTKTAADQVVRHAVNKHKDPDYQVPGLGEHLWDPTKNPDGSLRVPVSDKYASEHKAKPRPAEKPSPKVNNKSTVKLKDEEIDGIKAAVQSGAFDKKTIASMFNVSMKTLEEALGG